MRIRPKYKKQVSLPVDIGRLNNHQLVGSAADITRTPMRYNGPMSRTQPERAPTEDEAKTQRGFAKGDECIQVGLQLRTIADAWNRTYFENDDFHRQRSPQLGVMVFIVIFQMCT